MVYIFPSMRGTFISILYEPTPRILYISLAYATSVK